MCSYPLVLILKYGIFQICFYQTLGKYFSNTKYIKKMYFLHILLETVFQMKKVVQIQNTFKQIFQIQKRKFLLKII